MAARQELTRNQMYEIKAGVNIDTLVYMNQLVIRQDKLYGYNGGDKEGKEWIRMVTETATMFSYAKPLSTSHDDICHHIHELLEGGGRGEFNRVKYPTTCCCSIYNPPFFV